jgi:hypothetical protein
MSNEKGNFIFKPRARIIKTIGEELISNDNVAIAELVKNSYDAESQIVEIIFDGIVEQIIDEKKDGQKKKKYLAKNNASITIYDEGKGMNFDVIKDAWMEPATNFKRKEDNKSNKRKFTGEKGIGRFASAKLASKLTLITRQKESEEIVVEFNWDDFSNEDNYLENIKISWEKRQAIEIKNSGTILKLTNLKSDWDEDKIRKLRVALSRLLNPIVPAEDFLISVKLPKDLEKLDGIIERPETLNRPDYYIKGSITEKGRPDNFVFFSKKKRQKEELIFSDNDFLLKEPKRESVAGKFDFEFKIWNRDSENIKNLSQEVNSTTTEVRKDLNDLAGISIYRDNFRVLPYGNNNNDWIRLDLRRVNNPTKMLSNNQIIGYISISTELNLELKDQSNREGIIEGQAFEDIKDLIKLILNEVEQKRYTERHGENEKFLITKENLFERFSLKSISALIRKDIPNNRVIIEAVEKKDLEIKEGVVKVQEIISRYRRLTTLGTLIDVILHDGRDYLGQIDSEMNIMSNIANDCNFNKHELLECISKVQNVRKGFAQLFKRIEPFSGKKRGMSKIIILEEIIKNQFQLRHTDLERLGILYEIPNTSNSVTMDEAEVGIIFMNLIQNSIYWLENVSTERKIMVQIDRPTMNELSIIFSDSGPGIKDGTENSIFEPYFSTKPDGVGLGLSIVGELVSEYDGEFMLINNEFLTGAAFKIILRSKI